MTLQNVILFVFAGREANMRLQLQWVNRILDQHPNVRYDIWDLTRIDADHRYLRTIAGDRITVRTDFHQHNRRGQWNEVWKWYAARPEYADTLFVKVDDDVVYFDHTRWSAYIDMASTFRGQITSALTVNNGASTPLLPGLHDIFAQLDIPLLDVHTSRDYADKAHRWFLDHTDETLSRAIKPVTTNDWLSINCIAMHWDTLRVVAQMLRSPSPAHIAGRDWGTGAKLGDEGACNMIPRIIIDGITCAHLTFGPQDVPDALADEWRIGYEKLLTET